ncbi:helix-turn-helix transcriptional regulator [Rhizobium phaseoli]|uniref:helix-turn-helix transcriptional regulator n=1 Tax=Rhizobium phaseoli TaxID=396 RepID=UPI001FE1F07C|nr:AlpA family phage regulatory protein [Rhizobium phaseoli]
MVPAETRLFVVSPCPSDAARLPDARPQRAAQEASINLNPAMAPVTDPSLIHPDSTGSRMQFRERQRSTMSTTHANDNFALISLKDTCAMTSMSKTMIHRLRSEGTFPAAVCLGEKRIAFVREEVTAWIKAKIIARAA